MVQDKFRSFWWVYLRFYRKQLATLRCPCSPRCSLGESQRTGVPPALSPTTGRAGNPPQKCNKFILLIAQFIYIQEVWRLTAPRSLRSPAKIHENRSSLLAVRSGTGHIVKRSTLLSKNRTAALGLDVHPGVPPRKRTLKPNEKVPLRPGHESDVDRNSYEAYFTLLCQSHLSHSP